MSTSGDVQYIGDRSITCSSLEGIQCTYLFSLILNIGVLSQSLSLLILFLIISVTVLIEKLFFIIKVFLLHFQ